MGTEKPGSMTGNGKQARRHLELSQLQTSTCLFVQVTLSFKVGGDLDSAVDRKKGRWLSWCNSKLLPKLWNL